MVIVFGVVVFVADHYQRLAIETFQPGGPVGEPHVISEHQEVETGLASEFGNLFERCGAIGLGRVNMQGAGIVVSVADSTSHLCLPRCAEHLGR